MATIVLDRPAKLNAVTPAMADAIVAGLPALRRRSRDPRGRADRSGGARVLRGLRRGRARQLRIGLGVPVARRLLRRRARPAHARRLRRQRPRLRRRPRARALVRCPPRRLARDLRGARDQARVDRRWRHDVSAGAFDRGLECGADGADRRSRRCRAGAAHEPRLRARCPPTSCSPAPRSSQRRSRAGRRSRPRRARRTCERPTRCRSRRPSATSATCRRSASRPRMRTRAGRRSEERRPGVFRGA